MAIRRNDATTQRYNRIAQVGSRLGSGSRSSIDDDYDRIANANARLAADNVETTQQLSYKDYLQRKNNGITPKTSPAEQVGIADAISPDLASDSMASYAEYKNTKGAQLASYDLIADDVKDKLTELNNLRDTDNTGLFRKTDDGSGLFGYTLEPGYKENDIKKELSDVYNLSSSDVDSLAEVNKMAQKRDTMNSVEGQNAYENKLAEDAKKNYKRTYTEELDYAQEQFDSKGGDNAQDLRNSVTEYNNLYKTAQLGQAGAALEASTNIDGGNVSDENFRKADAMKASIMSKYNLSEDDWDDLVYYGQELDDYDQNAKEKQEAYENVHQDSVAKNIYGGVQNTLNSIGTYVGAPIGGIGELAKYYGGGYRDSASPINANSPLMSYSNASGDAQSATSEAISEKHPVAGMLYEAGMSSVKSRMTNVFMPKGDGIFSVLKNPELTVSAKMAKTLSKAGRDAAGLLPLFGTSVFTQELSNGLKSGKTMQDSISDAVAGTVNEVAWEIGPADTWADTAVDTAGFGRTAKSFVGKVVTNLLKNGLGEGLEEVGGSLTDRIYDDLKYGDKSDYNRSVQVYMDKGDSEEVAKAKATNDFVLDTIKSGTIGFMSGIMGGAMATGISVSNAVEASRMFDNYTAQDYADFANALDVGDVNNVADRRFATKETTDADGISWDAMNDLNNVDAYQNEDVNALYNADELGDDGSGSHEYASEEARQSAKNAKEIANRLSKQDSVSKLDKLNLYYAWQDAVQTEEEAQRDKAEQDKFNEEREAAREEKAHKEFEQHEKQTESYYGQSEQASDVEVPEDLKGETNNYTANDIYKRMANAANREELASAVQDGRNSSNENTRVQTERNLDALTSMLESKTGITESDIAAIKQSDADILAKAYRGEEVSVANNHQAQLVNYASQERIKAKAAVETANRTTVENNSKTFSNSAMTDIYTNGYQTDMNPNSYDRILKTVDAGGRNNIPLAKVRESLSADLSVVGGDAEALNSTIESAYETSQKIAKNDALNAIRAAAEKQKTVKFTSGIVTDDRSDKSKAIDDSIINFIAGYYGMDVSIVDDGSAPADVIGSQGAYRKSASKIYLNASAASQFAGSAIHEGVEVANFWAQEEMADASQAFQRVLLDTLGTDEYNKFRNTWYKNSYAMESGKTEIDFDKEMLADAAPFILTNKNGMQAFIDEYRKNATPEEVETFTGKLSKWIGDLKKTVKDFFKEFVPTDYQKRIRDNVDNFDEVQTLLQHAMATARKNYNDAKLAALAETLDVSTDTNTEPEVIQSSADAFQTAYNAFVNATEAVMESKTGYDNRRPDDVANAFIDSARALQKVVAEDAPERLEETEEFIQDLAIKYFTDNEQGRRVGMKIAGFKPMYEGVGTDNIPHAEDIELGEYSHSHKGKPVDGFMSIAKLYSAISNYESKYGIADETVRGLLNDAKRAVNGIDEALTEGYAGADGKYAGVIVEEGELFKAAMKKLDEYSHDIGIEGYLYDAVTTKTQAGGVGKKIKSINLVSIAASIRNIKTYQENRSVIGENANNTNTYDEPLPWETSFSRPVGPVLNSDGTDLKDGQKEYFKDSKAVDDDGRLKIMYHGSPNATFTVFDPAKSDDGISMFFTDNLNIAKTYSDSYQDPFAPTANDNARGGRQDYAVYLDIKNPMVVDFEYNHWNEGETVSDKNVKRATSKADKALNGMLEWYIDNWIIRDGRTHEFYNYIESTGNMQDMTESDKSAIRTIGNLLEYNYFDMVTQGAQGADVMADLLDGTIRKNTRDYAREAKGKGHDGVIFKNVIDEGPYSDNWMEMPSTVMVAFNSSQVKSIANENPTEDVDIRYSVEVGDSNNMNNDDIQRDRAKESSIIEKVYSAIKDSESTINRDTTNKIAKTIHSEFSSAYDLKTFQDNMYALFTYWHDGKHNVNMNDFMAVLQDVVRPVIDSAYTTQAAREDFAQFAEMLGQHEVALTAEDREAIKEAFGSMKEFEKHYPEIKISANGQRLSDMWSTLVEESGGLLPFDAETDEMAGALADTIDALRPTYNVFADDTQTAYDTTLDIVTKYLSMYHDDGATKGVINEMVDRATKELRASQKEWKQQAKERYNQRLAEEREKLKDMEQKYSRSKDQIAKLRAKNATRVKDIYEKRKVRDQLRAIRKTYKSLYDYAVRPTDNKHIPYSIQEPVYRLLGAIDMSGAVVEQGEDGKWHTKIMNGREYAEDGKHYKFTFQEITADTREEAIRQYQEALDQGLGSSSNQAWYDRMKQIDDLYKKAADDGEFNDANSQELNDFLQGLDQEIVSDFHDVLERAKEKKIPITSLNSKDLETVSKMLRNFLNSVNRINKSYTIASEDIKDIARNVIKRSNEVNGRKNRYQWQDRLINYAELTNAHMYTYLDSIGAHSFVDILIEAQNKKANIIREAQEYTASVIDELGITSKELDDWNKDAKLYLDGRIKLTSRQVMDLRELLMRPDAESHFAGGIKAGKLKGMTDTENVAQHLTMEQAEEITASLNDKQKTLADKLQQGMANIGNKYGNETSMIMNGYKKFNDSHYVRMNTDSDTHRTNTSQMLGGVANSIKNMGMTKAVQPNSRNALVIDDLVEVYAKHVSDMAVYSAWAPAVQDLIRFFNYKETIVNEDGSVDYVSTKAAIRKMYGDGGLKFFTKMVQDIQGGEQSSFDDGGIQNMFVGAAKRAATLANLRVVAQQPTAFFRAAVKIDAKYLRNALVANKEMRGLRDKMIETDPVFWIKQQGNIDGQVSQSMMAQITGIQSPIEKINDIAGRPAGAADNWTWRRLYLACMLHQQDVMGKDAVGTDEYTKAVNHEFDSLMLYTQVYDGTITRTEFMRSKDKQMQLLSAFMAEPAKTYNVALSAMLEVNQTKKGSAERKTAAENLAKSISVLTVTSIATAVAKSFIDAFRNAGDPDDEDDLDFIHRFVEAMGWNFHAESWKDTAYAVATGNLGDDLDPINNIPIIKDYWSDLKSDFLERVLDQDGSYYSSSDSLDSAWLSHLTTWLDATGDMMFQSDEDKDKSTATTYGYFAKTARVISDFFGIPLYSAQRDLVAAYNVLIARSPIGSAIEGATGVEVNVLQKTKSKSDYKKTKENVYKSLTDGSSLDDVDDAIETAVETSNTYDGINDGMKKALQGTLQETYDRNPSEATKMINRIAEIKAYLAEKNGTYKDKTHAEKVETYKKAIKGWIE